MVPAGWVCNHGVCRDGSAAASSFCPSVIAPGDCEGDPLVFSWVLDIPGYVVTEVCAMPEAASRLQSFAEQLLGVPLPMRIRAWDGSQAGPPGAPTVVVRNRRALRRLLWKPGELGLARAWVAGDLDIEGISTPPSICCPGWSGTAERMPGVSPRPCVNPRRGPRCAG